jgi:RHS repeat-associated protein
VSINNSTQQVNRRRHLPFGEPRGQAPLSWPSELGFVGGTKDDTGLTHLGAREYDPTLGRFISVDPILDLTNGQQMNGYTYSNNNPVTFSDPTELFSWEGDSAPRFDTGTCQHKKCDKPKVPPAVNEPSDAYTQMHYNSPVFGKRLSNEALDALKDRGYRGSALFTRREALLFATQSKEAAAAVCQAFADGGGTAPSACTYDVWNWEGVLTGLKAVLGFAYQLTPIPDAIGCAGGDGEACAWLAAGAIPGGRVLRAADNMADAAKAAHKAQRTCPSSFVPGTQVLMADGTGKPIEDIKVGDKVVATEPVSGETALKTVVRTITTQGWKDLVRLTVDTDGAGRHRTGTVVATATHPFWMPGKEQWLGAEAMRAGDVLRDVRGDLVDVTAVERYQQLQRVHNLTIAGIPTYYVIAGATSTLVHNCGNLWGKGNKEGEGWQHTLYNHVEGSRGATAEKTKFNDDYLDLDDIAGLIEDTASMSGRRNTMDPIDGRRRDGTIHTKEFGYPVGSNNETIVEVILNPDGSLRTAYPK